MSSCAADCMDSFADCLPSYSQSVPAPSYSFEPARDEQVLQHTPRSVTARPTPTGTFIKKSGKTTIILTEQEEGASKPTYGRYGSINGALLLEESELVTEVEFEIDARLDTTISEGGGKTTKLIAHKELLWSKQTASDLCPSQLPLKYTLPTTFRDGNSDTPLPPSYTGFFQGCLTLYVKTTYYIRIHITRLLSSKLGFLTKKKHILQPFQYFPRTRPQRAILQSPGFFSTIKTSPEEWFQASSTIKTRSSSSLDPLPVHLFLPAGRVYGMTDSIPFHLQITGHGSSLRELFSSPSGSGTLGRVLSSDSRTTISSSDSPVPSGSRTETKPIIRVYLMRQVSVEARGEKAWRNTTIGEGSLSPVPPMMSCSYSEESGCEEHLDWEGTLKCDNTVTVGGFATANVQVKEFAVLSITPSCPSKSQILDLQVSIPIRIVTDSCGYDQTAFEPSQ